MKRTRGDLACQAWQLLFELLMSDRPRVPLVAAECGLTEAQCHAVRLLEPGRAVPMRRLAEGLGCDASNITGIVDRLEGRGLIERRPCARDRRVREIALTPLGAEVRARILQRLGQPPAAIARLSAADQRQLLVILGRALGRGGGRPPRP